MTESTIFHDDYKFDIVFDGIQINIKLTEMNLYNLYQAVINESGIYVKPIKKFYSMFMKALNKEPDFNLTIIEKKGQLICNFGYNNEFVNIEETITFTKIDTQTTKELLLIDKIKELEQKIIDLESVMVGVQIKTDFKTGDRTSQVVKFNCNSTVLDFSPYKDDLNFRFEHTPNLFDYNRFTKVKKIIIGLDVLTIIPPGTRGFGGQNIFSKLKFYSLYTVEELVILCDCLDNIDINDYSESKFHSLYDLYGSSSGGFKGPIMHQIHPKYKDMITYARYISGMRLPNLKKISFIKSKVISFTHIPCAGGSLPFIPITIEEPESSTGLYLGFPKLKHIVFQNLKFYPKRESDKVKIEFI